MGKKSSNEDIAKSGARKPRVHITYKTFTNGAMKLVELPFVMGVMADLSGKNRPTTTLKERRFVEFDARTFDSKMREMKPTASFAVKNKLTGEGGDLNVKITFESMKDFTPEGIANKIEPLRKLLKDRERLDDLERVYDGKDTRQIDELLSNPQVMAALAALPSAKPEEKPEKN